MDPSQEEVDDIPMPINSSYIGSDMSNHHRNHHELPHNSNNGQTNQGEQHHQVVIQGYNGNFSEPKTRVVRYKECQKNHAASMGGNATDGCGEFIASEDKDSFEGLICSACNCHRNFHRKEIEGSITQLTGNTPHFYPSTPHSTFMGGGGRRVILGSALGHSCPNVTPFTPRSVPFGMAAYESVHSDNHDRRLQMGARKRFRTKFSQEQKEKMMEFAEKVGWKIQKQEECVVQQFCQEIGVKRRVLKVWMHNNKHNFANKTNNISNNNNNSSSSV
ncbi:hypothetical protein RND81_13G151500 [Saponaria officinalis]|uniref:ZF-HD dimerization-type domain-containing protein n=1 Tax=Saponaria officinalis TaxID=3572 RepID=A0AAW1H072_SAPOF